MALAMEIISPKVCPACFAQLWRLHRFSAGVSSRGRLLWPDAKQRGLLFGRFGRLGPLIVDLSLGNVAVNLGQEWSADV